METKKDIKKNFVNNLAEQKRLKNLIQNGEKNVDYIDFFKNLLIFAEKVCENIATMLSQKPNIDISNLYTMI